MAGMMIFGLGYSGAAIARLARARGWQVVATGSAGTLDFADGEAVRAACMGASHILSTVPPGAISDPVLTHYGEALRAAAARGAWLGYLSSTGVHGDSGGGWVDESAPLAGRRGARITADLAWQAPGAHIFRLPGIYGPGRSAFDRLASGGARRIRLDGTLAGHVFSRVHVDDIAAGVFAAIDSGLPGDVWNMADDAPASQNAVVEEACRLLGRAPPTLVPLGEAGLSPMALSFYTECRRVANGKARRRLGWHPRYRDFREGLAAIAAAAPPPPKSSPPR